MNISHTAFSGDFFSAKKALRQHHECWRRALPADQVATKGLRVFQQLQRLPPWHTSSSFALYAAQPFEVPASEPLAALLKARKRVCFPTLTDPRHPSLALVQSPEDLELGRYGIYWPKAYCRPVAMADIELIVVPGVAFAENGARLGRGGGFYDRLLAHPEMKALRVGLCFEESLLESLPEEAHDRRMHWVASDTRCIQGSP